MKTLYIKNVGPIKEVKAEINKFNFFIGPQSSGKSTIAKVFSTCSWLEKEVATTSKNDVVKTSDDFLSLMTDFHKMDSYFNQDSEICYETDVIKIEFKNNTPHIELKNRDLYHRQKICYIPSERNMVTLPELQGFEFGQTNLRSFLFDWFNARENYKHDNKADILNLGVNYYFNPGQQKYEDRIEHTNGEKYNIPLASASSGLQSVIPLVLMMRYYSNQYFTTYRDRISFNLSNKNKKFGEELFDNLVLKIVYPDFKQEERKKLVKSENGKVINGDVEAMNRYFNYAEAFNRLTIPATTSFIIEEPEQNLFPDTQTDLLDELISLCNGERKHSLTITTHSPYILNKLNLLFKRYDVQDEKSVGVNFDDVSVYAVNNGELIDLKLKNAHLVNPEYLSAPLDRIYTQYEEYDK